MRPIMRLILGLCALAVILAVVALALPGHVTVARSMVINAPESVVFPYLNNVHRFGDWSPWASRDPELTVSYSGPDQGKGAKVEWTSSKASVGTGSMEITESNPNRHIDLAVDFNGLDGTAYYDVAPSGSGSKVTWGLSYDFGTSPLKRWKGLMLDRYLGAEFRDGLGKLKDKVEIGAETGSAATTSHRDARRARAAWRGSGCAAARRNYRPSPRSAGGRRRRGATGRACCNRSGRDPSGDATTTGGAARAGAAKDASQAAKASVTTGS